MVEVEGVLPGERAVEPGLEVRAPAPLVLVGAAAVRLADARHARVDGLKRCEWSSWGMTHGRVKFLVCLSFHGCLRGGKILFMLAQNKSPPSGCCGCLVTDQDGNHQMGPGRSIKTQLVGLA